MRLFQNSLLLLSYIASVCLSEEIETEKPVEGDGYGVHTYECDAQANEIRNIDDRQEKKRGGVYLICFSPNEKAVEDGVGIAAINEFTWEMEHEDGTARQRAVINGSGDFALTDRRRGW